MAPTTFKVSKRSVMKAAWAMKKDKRFGWDVHSPFASRLHGKKKNGRQKDITTISTSNMGLESIHTRIGLNRNPAH